MMELLLSLAVATNLTPNEPLTARAETNLPGWVWYGWTIWDDTGATVVSKTHFDTVGHSDLFVPELPAGNYTIGVSATSETETLSETRQITVGHMVFLPVVVNRSQNQNKTH